MVRLEVVSDFKELWRYNIFAVCSGSSESGERLYTVGDEVISDERIQRGVVALLPPSLNFDGRDMRLELCCDDAARLEIEVYIVAHSLPEERMVESSPPFNCTIRVERDDEMIFNEIYKVNQWGGLTAKINLQAQATEGR